MWAESRSAGFGGVVGEEGLGLHCVEFEVLWMRVVEWTDFDDLIG